MVLGFGNYMADWEKLFKDNGDGTVAQVDEDLIWVKKDSRQELGKWLNWDEANAYREACNEQKYLGTTDWRLPTRKEAQSINDPNNPVTDAYGDILYLVPVFPPGAGQTTWTKTLHKTDDSIAIRFNYYSGDYKFHKKGLRSHGVRVVRTLRSEEKES